MKSSTELLKGLARAFCFIFTIIAILGQVKGPLAILLAASIGGCAYWGWAE